MIGLNRIVGTALLDPRVEREEMANAWCRRYECVSMESIENVPLVHCRIRSGREAKRSAHPFVSSTTRCCFTTRPTKEKKLPVRFLHVPVDRSLLLRYERTPCFLWVPMDLEGDPQGGEIGRARRVRLPLEGRERYATTTAQIQHATSGVAEAHRTCMEDVQKTQEANGNEGQDKTWE